MLYLFDLDNTLISGYMDNPDKDYNTWHVLPRRADMVGELLLRGNTACIVTNQGGVAFGYITEGDARAKIDVASVMCRFYFGNNGRKKRPVYVCYHDERGKPPYNDPLQAARRKPSGAMIREAMADYPEDAALGVLYVGDREEDLQAAQDAGVGFQWSHIFFKAQP